MKVLVACEYSGRIRDAFIALGHDAISCDLLPTEVPGPHYQGDVRNLIDADHGFDLMIAHPPCTRLANSGVRWLNDPPKGKTKREMWADFDEAVRFYCMLRDAPVKRKAIENPVMHRYARERIRPGVRQVVQPWWFGDPELKATGFELINLPELQPTNLFRQALEQMNTSNGQKFIVCHPVPTAGRIEVAHSLELLLPLHVNGVA